MAEPKVLLLDIETVPNILTHWGLRVDGYLDYKNILQERYIVCAAWKWLDATKVYSADVIGQQGKKFPDWKILRKLARAFNQADAVVAHNGDKFDVPWVLARMILQNMAPPKPFIQIDTKKIAKDRFYFNANRLDYLGQALEVGRKIKTDYDLWLDAMKGSKKAINEMVAYNKQDVLLLEKVYLKLRPFVAAKLNRALFVDDPDLAERTCPACGMDKLRAEGYSYTRQGKRRNFFCGTRSEKTGKLVPGTGCGAWSYKLVTKDEKPPQRLPR